MGSHFHFETDVPEIVQSLMHACSGGIELFTPRTEFSVVRLNGFFLCASDERLHEMWLLVQEGPFTEKMWERICTATELADLGY
jgi:hypothetical protein